jgi:tetratricopeptide (TPR) repeat protein
VLALARAGRAGLRDVAVVGGDPGALATRARIVTDFAEGNAAMSLGEPRGISTLRRAIAAGPRGGLVQQWGAIVVFDVGRERDLAGDRLRAIELYREALRSWPEFLEARLNLGRAFSLTGWNQEALAEYREALRINPESATAHRGAGELLRSAGDLAGALAHAREVVRISPLDAPARDALGMALVGSGQLDEALVQFLEASRLDPSWPVPLDRAALVLASHPDVTHRDVNAGIALARRALKLTNAGDLMTLETLAAVYAAGGRIEAAVETEGQALEVARRSADGSTVAQITATLDEYRHGRRLPLLKAQQAR